ncbi:unnamed protein product [Heligmosomoides polygyrus]|uniref:Uncharacterized protein n=1 Tax=Heligmosomoides polygyrus TaxID=6339 RepID=A0A183G2K7_HELPZ|nr:unnamed protein product [Heligmosomoides polygyrus]
MLGALSRSFRERHLIGEESRTAPDPDRIRPEHLDNLASVLISTLAPLFSFYLSVGIRFHLSGRPADLLYKTRTTLLASVRCP